MRNQSTLIVAEHNGEQLSASTRNAITAAKSLPAGEVTALVAGPKCGPVSN